jgi:hypothetical protein
MNLARSDPKNTEIQFDKKLLLNYISLKELQKE